MLKLQMLMKKLTKVKHAPIISNETNHFLIEVKSRIPHQRTVAKNPKNHDGIEILQEQFPQTKINQLGQSTSKPLTFHSVPEIQ